MTSRAVVFVLAAAAAASVGGVIDLTPAWAASRAIEKIEGKKTS